VRRDPWFPRDGKKEEERKSELVFGGIQAPIAWKNKDFTSQPKPRSTDMVRSILARTTAIAILLTCLICPLLELFDYWDETEQTGNDTEYALVLTALCVGASYSFVRFVGKSSPIRVRKRVLVDNDQISSIGLSCLAPHFFDDSSPPVLSLRI
jgi:hypothetical protein